MTDETIIVEKFWRQIGDGGNKYSISLNKYEGWDTESGNIGLPLNVAQYICEVLNKDIVNCKFETINEW